jgi:lipopolysaccharide export system permease protein
VRILSRYLLARLLAPFGYALAALTGFMLLNQVAKRFDRLVGKGLDWSVIAEVFALSIPFIVAMTLPMAVLVAVLFAFSHLASDNEITAMRAGGLSVPQILTPVLLWGVLMASANFVFVDQVLPRSNARLRTLLYDITRKKPTLQLNEQVINEIPPSQYFLRAGRIDAERGGLRDVVIYDVSGQSSRRVIYADSGLMAFAGASTDLNLTLYDGSVHEFPAGDRREFRLTTFRTNQIRVRNVFDSLQRNTGEMMRGDREMSSCEMLAVVREAERDRRQAEVDEARLVRRDLRYLLNLPAEPPVTPVEVRPVGSYCAWGERVRDQLLPGTAQAQAPAQAAGKPPAPAAALPRTALTTYGEARGARDRIAEFGRRADKFLVEIHKKWSISAACISFVLAGLVMALRFPRGGMGLVVGGGMTVFSLFYVALTAGEALADRGRISPALAMWSPNIVLSSLGVLGLAWVDRHSGSTRGGDLDEILEWARSLGRRLRGRR